MAPTATTSTTRRTLGLFTLRKTEDPPSSHINYDHTAVSPNTIAQIALTSDEMKDIETHLPFDNISRLLTDCLTRFGSARAS